MLWAHTQQSQTTPLKLWMNLPVYGKSTVCIACIWSLTVITDHSNDHTTRNDDDRRRSRRIFFFSILIWLASKNSLSYARQTITHEVIWFFLLFFFFFVMLWFRLTLCFCIVDASSYSTFFIFFDLVMWFLTLYPNGRICIYRIVVNVSYTARYGRMGLGFGHKAVLAIKYLENNGKIPIFSGPKLMNNVNECILFKWPNFNGFSNLDWTPITVESKSFVSLMSFRSENYYYLYCGIQFVLKACHFAHRLFFFFCWLKRNKEE